MNQGDSGGVLQKQFETGGPWVQIGVVSFGPDRGCGSPHPNGYSRISYLLEFISNITGISLH